MKIRSRMYLGAGLTLFILLVMFSTLFFISSRIKDELDNDQIADELLKNTSDLIILLNNFLIEENDRSSTQWGYKLKNINNILDDNNNKWYSAKLKNEFELLGNNYTKLINEYEIYNNLISSSSDVKQISRSENLKELLSGQLLINSENILSYTFEISSYSDSRIKYYNSLSIQIIIILSLIIFILNIVIYLITISRVSKPLTDLVKLVELVSKGELHHSVDIVKKGNDEVYHLSRGFNNMTKDLFKSFETIKNELKERKKVEEALRNLRNYFQAIIDSMPSVIICINEDYEITHWNSMAYNIYLKNPKEVIGAKIKDVDKVLFENISSYIIDIDKMKPATVRVKPSFKLFKHADIIVYPLNTESYRGFAIRIDDRTEYNKMEEVIVQSEKMMSLGGLAAGMAHEINNPLSGIMQSVDVLEKRLKAVDLPGNIRVAKDLNIPLDTVIKYLENRSVFRLLASIGSSGKRVSKIVKDMLGFARTDVVGKKEHDIKKILDETLLIGETDFNLKRVEIIKEYPDGDNYINCEKSKLQQVILNLLRNAAQAMVKHKVEKPQIKVKTYYDKNAGMQKIEIIDNGPGMPESVKNRIFEPFFTTKVEGEGTGLGLSVSYFIITNTHSGKIEVDTKEGEGTAFTISLPQ